MAKNDIILGAGEVYLYEFTGAEIPEHAAIETDDHNVGHCSGGFSISYTPTKYEVKNQYGKTVKTVLSEEAITAKTGILSWELERLAQLSTAAYDNTTEGKRKLTFGAGTALKTLLLRFVHTKDDGKKLRFTMIGQNGGGFNLEFASGKETTVDAELTAIEHIGKYLAELEEEVDASTPGGV